MLASFDFLLRGLLKGSESPAPHLIEMGAQAHDALWIKLIQPSRSLLDVHHKTRILQDLQVLGDSGTRYRQGLGEFVYGRRPALQLLKNRHARRIG
jgi:hypothetical protein